MQPESAPAPRPDAETTSPPPVRPGGQAPRQERAGASVQFADWGDWKQRTHAEHLASLAQLRGHLTPPRSQSAASPLSDERAYAVFERACGPAYGASFCLYKLYVRARRFAPLSE